MDAKQPFIYINGAGDRRVDPDPGGAEDLPHFFRRDHTGIIHIKRVPAILFDNVQVLCAERNSADFFHIGFIPFSGIDDPRRIGPDHKPVLFHDPLFQNFHPARIKFKGVTHDHSFDPCQIHCFKVIERDITERCAAAVHVQFPRKMEVVGVRVHVIDVINISRIDNDQSFRPADRLEFCFFVPELADGSDGSDTFRRVTSAPFVKEPERSSLHKIDCKLPLDGRFQFLFVVHCDPCFRECAAVRTFACPGFVIGRVEHLFSVSVDRSNDTERAAAAADATVSGGRKKIIYGI